MSCIWWTSDRISRACRAASHHDFHACHPDESFWFLSRRTNLDMVSPTLSLDADASFARYHVSKATATSRVVSVDGPSVVWVC